MNTKTSSSDSEKETLLNRPSTSSGSSSTSPSSSPSSSSSSPSSSSSSSAPSSSTTPPPARAISPSPQQPPTSSSPSSSSSSAASGSSVDPSFSSDEDCNLSVLGQQQQQLCNGGANDSGSSAISVGGTNALSIIPEKRVGCAHYKRRAKFVTPCCNKFYMCRYCHDENESHYFNRKTVTELICTECDTRQRVQAECGNCGVRFGKYTCLICNLFDDEDKDQYHCDGCGICRVGGKDRFFHCEVCNMCLPLQLKIDGHRCVENVSRSNCPVCLEDIHTSRIPCHIPDCGHLIHRTCFEDLLSSGHYACPTCQTSMIDMKKLWDYLDTEVQNSPMPKEYERCFVDILCKDCHKESTVKFHVVGLKCNHCGAYNTCRTKGATTCTTTATSADGSNAQ